jgi:CRISPR-associated endonuclease/helicase Cas3
MNIVIDKKLSLFWGKTDKIVKSRWNPLLLHLIDVASSADAILSREPPSTRQRMADVFGLTWEQAQPWLHFVIACHDLGKACPGFQCKWKWDGANAFIKEMGLNIPKNVDCTINHAFVSQIAIKEFLIENNWQKKLADKIADAVGCHHGERAGTQCLEGLEGNYSALGDHLWAQRRKEICQALFQLFKPEVVPTKKNLSGPDYILLAGLTSFADWIGSNEEWFPFGRLEDTFDLNNWWVLRKEKAQRALDALGWEMREPLSRSEASFQQVFNQEPRPLQMAIAIAVKEISEPAIFLVEAPMGEGKTEAAFYAHLELQRRLGHRGLYIALPTKATGNAMFDRTLKFLRLQGSKKPLDLQLLHGATLLNDRFQELRLASICTSGGEGQVLAAEWFTHKKRALLSEYGVGTIDQALLGILPVRHHFVRLWGLANRVVVFDEIHAYDTYTGTLFIEMVRWLIALNSSVILLSATLPPSIRRKLAEIMNSEIPEQDAPYPRLSVYHRNKITHTSFQADPSRRCILKIKGISHELAQLKTEMENKLENGGMGLILVNTVQRAQELYQLFEKGEPIKKNDFIVGKKLLDGTEIILFHARFPANQRQHREEYSRSTFGIKGPREGRKILIATQVAEQSLDLDFDCIATDLAPIDLLLQRAGRLWRHQRSGRPIAEPLLLIAGIDNEAPSSFKEPLWWSSVYREDVLLRTWVLLRSKSTLILPDEIDGLVQDVYEERVIIPDFLLERIDKALEENDGEAMAHKGQAIRATIGFPDDGSWDDPNRYLKADDDPGLHHSLLAQTRLGETSVSVIPLFSHDASKMEQIPDLSQAKEWSMRTISLSRKKVVMKLHTSAIPKCWEKSSLLRNCYPFWVDAEGCWIEDSSVGLDEELGLIYKPKEEK